MMKCIVFGWPPKNVFGYHVFNSRQLAAPAQRAAGVRAPIQGMFLKVVVVVCELETGLHVKC